MGKKIRKALSQIPGIERLGSLRVRSSGTKAFVDMRLALARELSFAEAHRMASLAERKVSELILGADVIVHADPEEKPSFRGGTGGRISDIMKEHQSLFIGYHDLNIVHHQDSYLVSMHLVMASGSHIEEAHKVCDHLERDINGQIPGAKVTIHIEPGRPIGKQR